MLLSSDKSPTSLNFLPDVHIVIVEMKQLVLHYEDVWVKLRALGEVPRTVNFITGPSKTVDVEQTLQIGAHGPRNLHVMLKLSELTTEGCGRVTQMMSLRLV